MENFLKKQIKPNKAKKKPIKIKYISSPMMVQAKNASEFRAIVQQLTGKNSNLYDDHEDQLYHNVSQKDTKVTSLGEFAAPNAAAAAASSWFSTHEDQLEAEDDHHHQHHHHPVLLQGDHHHDDHDHDHADENYSNGSVSTNSDDQLHFLPEFDDQTHFWKSGVGLSESSLCGFQSPCVFVG